MNPNNFDFETVVRRAHTGNMKGTVTPDALKERHIQTFDAAEMDFKTAPSVIEAVKRFADEGLFGFTLCDDEYRDAVVWWMSNARNTHIEPEWIEPTMGTIFSVATCIRMCVGEGENMIVMPPIYGRYEQAVKRIGGGRGVVRSELIHHDDGSYAINWDDLEGVMADPANKLLIVCNPNNPTGTVWDEEVLTRIAELAVKYDVVVYSDEIFAEYTFGGHYVPMYCTVNGGRNNGISATSLGKSFSFTGVNHANMIISDPELRERFRAQKYSDHYGSLEPMARAAVLGAYTEEGLAWKNAVQELVGDNDRTIRAFFRANLPEVVISPLEGTYELWLDWRGLGLEWSVVKRILDEDAMFVLEDGTDFGAKDGFARMNIATPKHVIEGALERLQPVIPKLHPRKAAVPQIDRPACAM